MPSPEPVRLAGCIIVDSVGRILMLHQNFLQRIRWETPGGKVETGETLQAAVFRECAEELGIGISVSRELAHWEFIEDGRPFEYTLFLARITSGTPRTLDARYDRVQYCALEQLREWDSELSLNARNMVDAFQGRRRFPSLNHLIRERFPSSTVGENTMTSCAQRASRGEGGG